MQKWQKNNRYTLTAVLLLAVIPKELMCLDTVKISWPRLNVAKGHCADVEKLSITSRNSLLCHEHYSPWETDCQSGLKLQLEVG